MQEALQQRIEEKEKALRTARKVARETAERRVNRMYVVKKET